MTSRVGFSWSDSSRRSSTIGSFLACICAAICSSTLAGDLVGQGGDDDLAVLFLPDRAHAHRAVCRFRTSPHLGGRRDDLGLGREVRARTCSHSSATVALGCSSSRMQALTTSRRLCGGMSVDMPTAMPVLPFSSTLGSRAGSSDGSCRVPSKLGAQSTVPWPSSPAAGPGVGGQPGFGVAHRGERLGVVRRAEIALAVDQRVAVGERLRHQHHGLVAGRVAVRVELAEHVADRAGRLLVLGGGAQAQFAHRVDDAPLHRLEAVADVRQGAVQHDVHRIVEVGLLGTRSRPGLCCVLPRADSRWSPDHCRWYRAVPD
jgi:hypothetical protein